MTVLNDRLAGLSPEKRALLSKKLAQAAKAKASQTTLRRDDSQPPIASLVQQGFWALEHVDAGSSLLNLSVALRLRGELHVPSMERALSALVERHEALRARFSANAAGELQVEISPCRPLPLPLVDLTDTGSGEREAKLSVLLQSEVNRPFLLDREDLIRAVLYRLGDDQHVLQLTMHHLVIDGWGIGIAFRDLAALYNAALTGQPAELPELPVRFTDFARWHREQMAGPEGDRQMAFWLDHLDGSPKVLSLPTDRPRPPYQTFAGATRGFSVSPDLMAAIHDCCLRENLTQFMVMLAAIYSVFAKYTGQTDILVGAPMAARLAVETEQMVGCFTNTVVLRGKLDGDPTFHDLLQRVRKTAIEAFAHQSLPFDVLKEELPVQRDPSRTPIIQVLVVYQNTLTDSLNFDGLDARIDGLASTRSKVDLTIELIPRDDSIQVRIEYNTDLFDGTTIDRLWNHVALFLERGIADRQQEVAAIPLLTDGERKQLLVDWNQTASEYPKDVPLAALVEAQVERTPNAVALVCGGRQLTYCELNERANQLAHHLRTIGAGPNRLVGVCLNRSVDQVVALLAIVKAGAAYFPIEPLMPAQRIQYLLNDSAVSMLVTEKSLTDSFPSFQGTLIRMEDENWQSYPRENLAVPVTPTDLAYLLYTSGSTGKPKGVQVPRQALTNLLWSMRNSLRLTEADRVLAVTTISFDIAGLEIWLPLLVGAQTILATREDAGDGNALCELIERHDITFMQATPVTWQLMFQTGWKGKPDLQAICTGEALPQDLAVQLVPAVGRLWNMYGPTETTIWSTGFLVEDATQPILIGRPIANTQCYILDSQLQPVPINVTGDLYIGGDGLAIGYLNRPDLTAAAFVSDPFAGGDAKMYRTGDLARFRADGNIECLGRSDHQVKIFGHRIELGEIEAALKDNPEVSAAVVTLREDLPGEMRLVAYIVPTPGSDPEPVDLMRKLKLSLPYYMVPTVYQTLENLPVSSSGKIDRRALPAPDVQELTAAQAFKAPRGPIHEMLALMWSEVLDVPRVGIHDDYFELGGDSLQAVRLILKIRQAFPESRPTLATFLRAPTIEQFAQTLLGGDADWSCLVPVREGTNRTPFFCVHGAGGNWMTMRSLAMEMPGDLPIYCLQARGLDGKSPPFSSVEETAECYLEHIRSVQPQGPYNLAGYCYGGLVAFEMAHQLRAAGETVRLLAMIDAHNHTYSSPLLKAKIMYFKSSFLVRRTLHHLRQINELNPEGRREYLWKRIKIGWREVKNAAGLVFNSPVAPIRMMDDPESAESTYIGDDLEKTLAMVRHASVTAALKYVPKPYDGHITVFRATERLDDPYCDMRLGWGPVAMGGVTTHEIDSNHYDIVEYPAVTSVAAILDAALRTK